jgi:hypothetical protein
MKYRSEGLDEFIYAQADKAFKDVFSKGLKLQGGLCVH